MKIKTKNVEVDIDDTTLVTALGMLAFILAVVGMVISTIK